MLNGPFPISGATIDITLPRSLIRLQARLKIFKTLATRVWINQSRAFGEMDTEVNGCTDGATMEKMESIPILRTLAFLRQSPQTIGIQGDFQNLNIRIVKSILQSLGKERADRDGASLAGPFYTQRVEGRERLTMTGFDEGYVQARRQVVIHEGSI